VLHLYRRAIATRRATPELVLGSCTPVASPEGTLAFRRVLGDATCTVLVNFGGDPVDTTPLGLAGLEVLLVSDDPAPVARFSGVLGADQAVVVRH
jgi:glycosidase